MNNNAKPQTPSSKQVDLTTQLLRLMGLGFVLEGGSLVLGFAFFLIIHSLFFGMLWAAPYWEPAHRLYTRVLQIPPTQFARQPLPWWRTMLLGLKALVVIAGLVLGIWILVVNGFLGQNLIYALLQSSN